MILIFLIFYFNDFSDNVSRFSLKDSIELETKTNLRLDYDLGLFDILK